MNDAQLQKKLNALAALVDVIEAEAVRRYGKTAQLFFEAEGSFFIMDGDSDGCAADRQKHIRFASNHCRLSSGAW